MERKVGEIFTCYGKTYKVIKGNRCIYCDIGNTCILKASIIGPCTHTTRTDKTDIVFKEIKNMEIKNNQLTIDIPKGMEIDLENSELAKGIVKFKKKDITYEDILQAYATDFGGIRVPNHCIDKILAISQLMNIAKYYNGDWKPNLRSIEESKYYIYYNTLNNTYGVVNTYITNYGNIYFSSYKDAQAVIDNPNFKSILDEIFKK